MTAAALSPARPRVARNPWLVAAIVVVPAFMEVLDTTIVLVALRYIAGGLSAAADDAEWVITSYLAANAVILPITGWSALIWVAATTSWRRLQYSPSVLCCADWLAVSVS